MNMIKISLILLSLCFYSCNSDTNVFSIEDDFQFSKGNAHLQKINKKRAVKVFRTAGAIVIDGSESEWSDVPKRHLREEVDTGSPISKKNDLSGYFKVLWDDDHLYFFANILDEEINLSGVQLFERDGLEIYIDGDNSKNAAPGLPVQFPPVAYDSNDDFFRFIQNQPSALSAWGIIDASNFEFAIVTTSKGYNVEVKMSFDDLPDFPAETGHEFGLEIQLNENDQDERQNFLKWESALDNSYFDPSIFGTAVLFHSIAE